jgi:hypothetical protein
MLSLITAYTQAQEDSTKTNKVYRNHIGINTQFAQDQFFNPQARTPIQFMYKRQNKKNNGAWRLGVEWYYTLADTSDFTHYQIKTGVLVGYEKQVKILKNFHIYYGADIRFRFNRNRIDGTLYFFKQLDGYENVFVVGSKTQDNTSIDIKPFLGYRYNILKNLYLSLETTLIIGKSYSEEKEQGLFHYQVFPYTRTSYMATRDSSELKTVLSPYTGIYIFYIL